MDIRGSFGTRGIAVLAVACVTMGVVACKSPSGSDAAATSTAAPAPPPAAPADPSGDVTRYGTLETAAAGSMTIRQAVPARKAADRFSAQILVLQPGSAVTRVAQYGGFTLASWNNGSASGWVETAVALHSTFLLDAGVQFQPGQSEPAFFDGGITTPSAPVAQPVQPVVQPPVAQPQPVAQPTPTVAAPKPVVSPGFKPPKLH